MLYSPGAGALFRDEFAVVRCEPDFLDHGWRRRWSAPPDPRRRCDLEDLPRHHFSNARFGLDNAIGRAAFKVGGMRTVLFVPLREGSASVGR